MASDKKTHVYEKGWKDNEYIYPPHLNESSSSRLSNPPVSKMKEAGKTSPTYDRPIVKSNESWWERARKEKEKKDQAKLADQTASVAADLESKSEVKSGPDITAKSTPLTERISVLVTERIGGMFGRSTSVSPEPIRPPVALKESIQTNVSPPVELPLSTLKPIQLATVLPNLEIASASIQGSDHRDVGRNNQDGCQIVKNDRAIVMVVTDGCGSKQRSEVGAVLGAHLVANELLRVISVHPPEFVRGNMKWLVNSVGTSVLERVRVIANLISNDPNRLVEECFLFTIVGVAVLPDEVVFFSVGDGLYGWNGKVFHLGPFKDNAPPYLLQGGNNPEVHLGVRARLPTRVVDSFIIATDGAQAFTETNALERRPDAGWFYGLAKEDRLFQNSDMLRRKLAGFAKTTQGTAVESDGSQRQFSSILHDDTSIILARRKKEPT